MSDQDAVDFCRAKFSAYFHDGQREEMVASELTARALQLHTEDNVSVVFVVVNVAALPRPADRPRPRLRLMPRTASAKPVSPPAAAT